MRMRGNMIKWILVWGSILLPGFSFAQLKTHSFEQVEALQKTAPRHVVIFIHTDWCRYCDAMKTTTFKNAEVIKSLNEKFYLVQLNAEEKREVLFNNHRYKFKPNGTNTGTHELAQALGTIEGKTGYPVLVMLNSKREIVFQYSGFMNSKALRNLLINSVQ